MRKPYKTVTSCEEDSNSLTIRGLSQRVAGCYLEAKPESVFIWKLHKQ